MDPWLSHTPAQEANPCGRKFCSISGHILAQEANPGGRKSCSISGHILAQEANLGGRRSGSFLSHRDNEKQSQILFRPSFNSTPGQNEHTFSFTYELNMAIHRNGPKNGSI